MATKIEAALERLEQYRQEKPLFPETAFETVILVDLFRDALGFLRDKSKRQASAKGSYKSKTQTGAISMPTSGNGRADIVLHLTAKMRVVVEVKQAFRLKKGALGKNQLVENTIAQAARYALKMDRKPNTKMKVASQGPLYGIVTDSKRWIYFVVVETDDGRRKLHRAHTLLDFDAEEHHRLAKLVLKRSEPGSLKAFLHVIDAIHRDMTKQEFLKLKNSGVTSAVTQLVRKADEAGFKATNPDKLIFQELYKADGALTTAIFESIRVLEPKRKKRTTTKQAPTKKRSHA